MGWPPKAQRRVGIQLRSYKLTGRVLIAPPDPPDKIGSLGDEGNLKPPNQTDRGGTADRSDAEESSETADVDVFMGELEGEKATEAVQETQF